MSFPKRRPAAWVASVFCLLIAGCATDNLDDPVLGRLEPVGGIPQTTELITRPNAGGGVLVGTIAGGGGQNVVGISASETDRLIGALGATLKNWDGYVDGRPFREMIHFGAMGTGRANPFTLELMKTPAMSKPQFVVTLGLSGGLARFYFDRANARRWGVRLAEAAGY